MIANLGFADRWELVLEGRQHLLLGSAPNVRRSRIVDTALNVKTVLRPGALQGEAGVSAHLNVGVALARDKHLDLPASLILEGPWTWAVRPVFEVFSEFEGPSEMVISTLGGLIWRASDSLTLDAGLRVGRSAGQPLLEGRLGLTVSLDLLRKTEALGRR